MFNNNKDDEADFCESYKSQVLGTTPIEKETSFFSTFLKLLTILMLLAIIIGVSFYGYNYFMNKKRLDRVALPPVSIQTSDDELLLEDEDLIDKETITKTEEKNNALSIIKMPISDELEINKIANDVKVAIAQSELKEENNSKDKILDKVITNESATNKIEEEKSLEVPTLAPEAQYLEELADLSKEIDKERKQ